ncbi:hypothetical protein EVG20_g6403 [Dentipellis fragilis]|uniref:Uncharacterized protein n=1 Tax=Dentipellis fragilis TaxID=205917 RepID=A0A4Y9YMS2_9AGAM|nr:hypothetical protein EVG20_g6403 [Dentipellis fragilis]
MFSLHCSLLQCALQTSEDVEAPHATRAETSFAVAIFLLPTMSDTKTPTAAELKAEGNALFIKQEFLAASYKYTAAIEEDASNAILYSNRAACYMGLKRYVDAISDAGKATEVDPKYAKAWSRLASAHDARTPLQILHNYPRSPLTPLQALNAPYNSISAWKSAIAALPVDDTKMRTQYTASLRAAEAAKKRMETKPAKVYTMPSSLSQETPWVRAQKRRDQLSAISRVLYRLWRHLSSQTGLGNPVREFKQGLDSMSLLKQTPTPQGTMMVGKPDALTALSNAIMRDQRVFHITQPDFLSKYNAQAAFEAQRFDAWVSEGPDTVLEQAKKRLATKGWDAVRPALATTVRGYIMRGFLEDGLRQNRSGAVEFVGNALSLIEGTRAAWPAVSKDDRGAVFEWTFLQGVRSLYLDVFQHAYASAPGLNSNYPLETLYERADELLKDMTKGPAPADVTPSDVQLDAGFLLSFSAYPRSNALAMKGYYHNQLARIGSGRDPQVACDHLSKGAAFYLQAANCVPIDDEKHAWYLWCSLEASWRHGAPLKHTLPLMARIRIAIPLFKPIWEHSSSVLGHKVFDTALWFEEDAKKGIREGKYTEENPIIPEQFSHF